MNMKMKYAELKLGKVEAIMNRLGGEEGAERLLRGETKVILVKSKKTQSIFRSPAIVIPAATENFVVTDHFKIGNMGITWLSEEFESRFLSQIVAPREGYQVSDQELAEKSQDDRILKELGPCCELDLSALATLLSRGTLRHDVVYILYAYDNNGERCVVAAGWYGDGWYLYAFSVSDPSPWSAGLRVLSRILE